MNYRDPVPHLPTQIMGYYHVPVEVWYYDKPEKSSKYKICGRGGYEEDEKCSGTQWIGSTNYHSNYFNISSGCTLD